MFMKPQKILNSQSNPEKKKKKRKTKNQKAEGISLPDFKIHYKSVLRKQHGTNIQTHRPMEQNGEPQNSSTYVQIRFFDKDFKNTH